MNKKGKLFLTTLLSIFLVACSSDSGSPEGVAEKYLNHLAKGEFDKASKLGTEDTKQLLAMMQSLVGENEMDDGPDVESVECEVSDDGETASCTYCCNENGEEDKLELKKEGGKWLIDMKKETPEFDDADFDMDFDDSFDQDASEESGME